MVKKYFSKFICEFKYLNSLVRIGYKYNSVKVYQKKGLVSIIIPVYNHAKFVCTSVDSCLNQTYKNIEIIIIDDGSTDSLQEVLKKYKNNPKVKLYKTRNQGLPKALTTGFRFANGEFYTWTSADNEYKKGAIMKMVRFLRLNPRVQMTYTNYTAVYNDEFNNGVDSEKIILPSDTKKLNTEHNKIGACFLWRSFVGRAINEWSPEMGVEDYDYWMRINNFFNIRKIDSGKSYYIYNFHKNSLTGNREKLKIAERTKQLQEFDVKRRLFNKEKFKFYCDSDNFDFCDNIKNIDLNSKKNIVIFTSLSSIDKYKKHIDKNHTFVFYFCESDSFSFDEGIIDCFITSNSHSNILKTKKTNSFYIKNINNHVEFLQIVANNELFFRKHHSREKRRLKEVINIY